MPLDHLNGEVLDGLPASMHIVVPPREFAAMSNLMVEYQHKRKFGTVTKRRPLFDDAVAYAIEGFAAKGALRPICISEDDVLVQVYPNDLKVSVIFQRKIATEIYYVTRYYDLPRPIIQNLLANAGKNMPSAH